MEHGRGGDQTQVLVEAWVPACAGMARKGNSQIVTMFVEALQPLCREDDDICASESSMSVIHTLESGCYPVSGWA
jgi:hypothetical protein